MKLIIDLKYKKLKNHYAINDSNNITILFIDCSKNKFLELKEYLKMKG